jgi:hypothetical protein
MTRTNVALGQVADDGPQVGASLFIDFDIDRKLVNSKPKAALAQAALLVYCDAGSDYARAAGWNPSQPLTAVTFRCKAAFFGKPHPSTSDSGACLLLRIWVSTCLSDWLCSPKWVQTPH